MTWLVTGGAGYIGAHVVRALLEAGIDAGRRRRPLERARGVRAGGRAVRARHRSSTARMLAAGDRTSTTVTGVIHVAGFKYAGVSVQRPLHTYEQNVDGHRGAARRDGRRRGIDRIVFSSSAAVYGTPDVDLVTEDTAEAPAVAVRRDEAHRRVAAARPGGRGRPAAHLAALLQRRRLRLPGRLRHQPAQPVPARVRRARRGPHAADQRRRLPDARRHERARLRARRRPRRSRTSRRRGDWMPASRSSRAYNLGSGDGVSVAEIMAADGRASPASTSTPEIGPRRPGDPAADRRQRASSPHATSTGRCGTRSTRWWRARGRRARHPERDGAS